MNISLKDYSKLILFSKNRKPNSSSPDPNLVQCLIPIEWRKNKNNINIISKIPIDFPWLILIVTPTSLPHGFPQHRLRSFRLLLIFITNINLKSQILCNFIIRSLHPHKLPFLNMYDTLDTPMKRQHTVMMDPTLSIVLSHYFLAHEDIDMLKLGSPRVGV